MPRHLSPYATGRMTTNRAKQVQALRDVDQWDVVAIGGGATGLGVALEAASRGYRTLVLEQADLAHATSSRSTKLVHGGVRYLKQGNISLVLEALKERGVLRKNAPHLVRNRAFIVPNYEWWGGPFYGVGLKLYDVLAGKQGFGRSKRLSRSATIEKLPTLSTEGLNGGVIYYDGQFDDSRMAVNMAQTAVERGATVLNYCRVEGLLKSNDVVSGVVARDAETQEEFSIDARVVINATGVFTDEVRRMDDPQASSMIRASQGIHVILDRSFLPGDTAIMVPKTDDGRVLFAIPWRDRVIVGTTDTPVDTIELEPKPFDEELEFLLTHVGRYLNSRPTRADIKSTFAGLRPLVGPAGDDDTAAVSRDHTLHISAAGLVTITGGKWTTYRKMAEDTVDQAATLAGLEDQPSVTRGLHLHGYHPNADTFGLLAPYGSDAPRLQALMKERPELAEPLHPERPVTGAQVVWAARHELARTVEDVLSRRTRSLLLDARASIAMAPAVAALLAEELGHGDDWQAEQVTAYEELAATYLVDG